MTKEDLIKVAQRCWATWNQTPNDIKAAYEAWWAILSDLDADDVNKVVDRLSVSSTFCPKPGELRRVTLGEDVPTPAEAWASYRSMADSLSRGTAIPEMHLLVKECIKKVGPGLVTNSDREHFLNQYGEELARYRQENFAP